MTRAWLSLQLGPFVAECADASATSESAWRALFDCLIDDNKSLAALIATPDDYSATVRQQLCGWIVPAVGAWLVARAEDDAAGRRYEEALLVKALKALSSLAQYVHCREAINGQPAIFTSLHRLMVAHITVHVSLPQRAVRVWQASLELLEHVTVSASGVARCYATMPTHGCLADAVLAVLQFPFAGALREAHPSAADRLEGLANAYAAASAQSFAWVEIFSVGARLFRNLSANTTLFKQFWKGEAMPAPAKLEFVLGAFVDNSHDAFSRFAGREATAAIWMTTLGKIGSLTTPSDLGCAESNADLSVWVLNGLCRAAAESASAVAVSLIDATMACGEKFINQHLADCTGDALSGKLDAFLSAKLLSAHHFLDQLSTEAKSFTAKATGAPLVEGHKALDKLREHVKRMRQSVRHVQGVPGLSSVLTAALDEAVKGIDHLDEKLQTVGGPLTTRVQAAIDDFIETHVKQIKSTLSKVKKHAVDLGRRVLHAVESHVLAAVGLGEYANLQAAALSLLKNAGENLKQIFSHQAIVGAAKRLLTDCGFSPVVQEVVSGLVSQFGLDSAAWRSAAEASWSDVTVALCDIVTGQQSVSAAAKHVIHSVSTRLVSTAKGELVKVLAPKLNDVLRAFGLPGLDAVKQGIGQVVHSIAGQLKGQFSIAAKMFQEFLKTGILSIVTGVPGIDSILKQLLGFVETVDLDEALMHGLGIGSFVDICFDKVQPVEWMLSAGFNLFD